ncbi:MAG: hypothetical protein JWN79_588, partial [Gemmatimonadetes bacterium]|nr:hypothetical protein [Gemmatimonadota bacterium]
TEDMENCFRMLQFSASSPFPSAPSVLKL